MDLYNTCGFQYLLLPPELIADFSGHVAHHLEYDLRQNNRVKRRCSVFVIIIPVVI